MLDTKEKKRGSKPAPSRRKPARPRASVKPKVEAMRETAPKKDVVRFCALGGLEEIGRNMMFLEYGDDILIIDMGLEFPSVNTPGIDYIIPNTTYLEVKKRKIRGIVITHGHYDHIGAIPHLLEKLGNPKIYATELTKEVIEKRQGDYPNSPKPIFDVVKAGETRQIGKSFNLEFFAVEHNIPEGFGLLIKTPIGNIVHPGEFKFDYDKDGNPRGMEIWERLGKEGIHTLMLDSTGAEVPGWSVSERVVEEELEKLFKSAKGRIIIGTFASLLDRLKEIIHIAERLDKVIAISGYSMKNNFEIAKRLGFIKTKRGTIISLQDIRKYPDNKVMVISTGAQNEKYSGLWRIANKEHKQIKLKETDMVILSSSIVPGNEMSVQELKDNLARQGAAIYHYKMLDIHSSGHAPQEELKTVMKKVNPKFFLPIHGYYFMRQRNAKMAQEVLGLKPEETVISDNGVVVEFGKNYVKRTSEQVPASYVMVDGLGVGDVGEIVLRDRRALAEEGMIVLITTVSRASGKVLKNPDIISRGFVYLRENQNLLNDIRKKIRGIVGRMPNWHSIDVEYVKSIIQDQIGSYLFRQTARRPMILPVIIEV